MAGTVVLLGTMDTKGAEYAFVRDRLRAAGVQPIVVDVGVQGSPSIDVDVSRDEVARAAGTTIEELVRAGDRGGAITAMADGAQQVVARLHADGKVAGVLALGGSGGTTLASQAFRPLPIGVPKMIVSTVASGNTAAYVGESDLVLLPSVADIAGINRISSLVLANAADAMAGAVRSGPPQLGDDLREAVAASMFGVTTSCVDTARGVLDATGLEVLVFHMTGVGGRSLERLVSEGLVAGVLDVTTTELADELVGGLFSAGPERLTAAARTGTPQVVSVGALDMVNFGPAAEVPERFAGRNLLVHNPTVTLMRTTPRECAELGKRLAQRVSATTGPACVVLPLRGVSAVSVDGGPFHDPEADDALFGAIRQHLDTDSVELVELDTDINDPEFAQRMCAILQGYLSST